MKYTRAEKEKLIAFLKEESDNRIRRLEGECLQLAKDSETKILRRLNNVSATLWNVQLKDVLMIERHHKPSIKHLISDIKSLQQELSFLSYNSAGDSSMAAAASAGRPLRSVSDSKVNKPSRTQSKQRTASSHH